MIASIASKRIGCTLLAVGLWTACGSSDERAPPPSTNRGGAASTSNASGARAGSAQGASAGDISSSGNAGEPTAGAASGGSDGVGAGGGATTDAGAPGTAPNGVCQFELRLGPSQSINASTSAADLFGSVTPDELVIAWTTVAADLVQLHCAERASVDDPFGTPRTLTIDAVPDRVGMSPDGLRIVYTEADGKAFSVVSRETQSDDFRPSDSDEMSVLNGPDRALAAEEHYGDPVISSNDLMLLHSRFAAGRTHTLFLSRRASRNDPWPDGVELATATRFDAVDDYDRFQPSGLSSDGKTLFLWHEAEMLGYAVFFDAASSSFESSLTLGGLSGAMPNADCSRLYYDSGGVSADLFFAQTR